MGYAKIQKINIDEALGGTFDILIKMRREIGVYMLIFLALAILHWTVKAIAEPFVGIVSIVGTVLYFYFQYRLYQTALNKRGIVVDARVKGFSFAGLAMLIGLGMWVASILFFVPALIVGSKWVMAPVFVATADRGLLASMGESWRASSGNTLPLTIAFSVIWFVWFVVFSLAGGLAETVSHLVDLEPLVWVAFQILPVMMMALSLTAYEKLAEEKETLEDVFS